MKKTNKKIKLIKRIKNILTFIFIVICFIIVASFDTIETTNEDLIQQTQQQRINNMNSWRQ